MRGDDDGEVTPHNTQIQSVVEEEGMVDEQKTLIANKSVRDYPNVIVFALIIVFGLSSWIVVNGVYTALPLLMIKLPESYEIAADMNLALQLANVFPFLFFVFTCLIPWRKVRWHLDTVAIGVLICVGIVACVLMAFLWDHVTVVAGKKRSVAFLSLVFVTGAVDTTSSVVYWPFISNYKYYYTTALSIGEGMTGLVSGIIGLIMQPGPDPVFSFPVFAGILAILLALSGIAFLLLRFLPYCKTQMIQPSDQDQSDTNRLSEQEMEKELRDLKWNKVLLSTRLIFVQTALSFVQNGILVAISAYVFHAYPKSDLLLRYSIIISQIVDPIACLLAYLTPVYNWVIALFVHLTWLAFSIVLFVVALKNPNSPRSNSLGMGIGLVVITVLTKIFMSFGKTSEWLLAHKQMKLWKQLQEEDENKHSFIRRIEVSPSRLAGIGIQLGALAGAIMMILFTKYNILHSGY